ncbi:GIY-YIG nuclease family protein [Bacillus sp. T3]|uniref:GIY-YIG nuclease family protein n=1 Tax=Bacillus sp. T3 TaxID=467262 RepID=UPI0029829BC9|nr:GIY-YIG nuclease family protein [Bacillus sp. T3]
MKHDLLSRGVYAIINKKLNTVYVGKTERNFLIRWIEHLNRISYYQDDPKRLHLYLNKGTRFIILKKMDSPEYQNDDFYRMEDEAREFYIKKGWDVLSNHKIHPTYKTENIQKNQLLERYRKAVKQMAYVLAAINTNHSNGSLILFNIYKKVDKYFQTNINGPEGKNPLGKLNKEELEFVLLELYPRFYHKQLDLLRKEYQHITIAETLFDFVD